METKIYRDLGRNFYNFAKDSDLNSAKEVYIKYLNNAKKSPSIAKLMFRDSLRLRKDELFREARHEAAITGSAAPIAAAVQKNSVSETILEKIQKDKDVRPLQKQVEKLLNHLYKKTKNVRNKAKLTDKNSVSLEDVKSNRNKSFFARFF